MLPLTDWAASILEKDEDILVPVKKLWVEYCKKHSGVSLEEFTRILHEDKRLAFEEGVDHTEGFGDWSEAELAEYVEEMEAQGFYSGARVRMADREITPEHISRMLKKHTDRMMSSLWSAYDVRPDNLPEGEQQELLDLIAAAKHLQLELIDMIPPKASDGQSGESAKPRDEK